MSNDTSNKENRVVPGRVNLSFEHLLYVQYRLKFCSEVKFLLKRSLICGFDFKCQLCKSLLKASEFQEHCGKAKHIKKMKDVAQLFYNQSERVLQILCDPRLQVNLRDIRLPVGTLPSSASNSLAQASNCVKNSSDQPNITEHHHTLTSNTEHSYCQNRLDTASQKKTSYESENFLRIDVQSKKKSLSSLQISAYKKILFIVCNKNVARANFYDFDCNWKIILVHMHNVLLCSLYSFKNTTKSVVAAISQYDLPSSDGYAVLAVLSRPIVEQPIVHPTSNIKYWRVWRHLQYLVKPTAKSSLLSNMSSETTANNSTLTSFRQNHVYLYLDSFPTSDGLRAQHLTFHTYKILSAAAESNELIAVEADKNLNEPKSLDHGHIFNLHLDSFNTMYQLHSQEMFDIFKNLQAQSKDSKCSVTEPKSLDHGHIFNLHLDTFNTMYQLHSQEMFDIFKNLEAQSKDSKCSLTEPKVSYLVTTEVVKQDDFDQSCPKESVNMATLDPEIFSNKHINLYLDHFSTMRNFKYQEKLFESSVNEMTDSQKIEMDPQEVLTDSQKIQIDRQEVLTDSQKIQIDPQEVLTDPQKILTDPQKILTDPQKILTDPQKIQIDPQEVLTDSQKIQIDLQEVLTDPQKILTDPQKILPDSQKILTDSQKIQIDPQEVLTDSQKIQIDPQEVLTDPQKILTDPQNILTNPRMVELNVQVIPSNALAIQSVTPSEPICQFSDKIDLKTLEQKYVNLYLDTFPNLEPSMGENCLCIFESTMKNNAEVSATYRIEPQMSFMQFMTECSDLELEDLLKVQYQTVSGDWFFLFSYVENTISCTLCNLLLPSDSKQILYAHIKSRFHQILQKSISQIYHPIYYSTKRRWIQIQDETNSRQAANSSKEASLNNTHPDDVKLSEFKSKYIDLPINDLYHIQYRTNSVDWHFMFTKSGPFYLCNLCGNTSMSSWNILNHLKRKAHIKLVQERITGMHHPNYFPRIGQSFPVNTLTDTVEPIPIPSKAASSENFSPRSNIKPLLETITDTAKLIPIPSKADFSENISYRSKIKPLLEEIPIKPIHQSQLKGDGSQTDRKHEVQVKESKQRAIGENQATDVPKYISLEVEKIKKLNKLKSVSRIRGAFRQKQIISKSWVNSTLKNSSLSKSLERFKIDYVKLNVEALLEVKYTDSKNHWVAMVTLKEDYIYVCNLCGALPLGSIQNLKTHILGMKHKLNVKSLNKIYHPIHCKSIKTYSATANKENVPQTPPAKIELAAVNKSWKKISNNINETPGSRLERFKINYVKLNAEALLEVEYMNSKNPWMPMITLKDDYIYICNLCDAVPLGSIQNLKTHILCMKHKLNVKSINKMYHPTHYTSKETYSIIENKQVNLQIPSARPEILAVNKNKGWNNVSNDISEISEDILEQFKVEYVKLNAEALPEVEYMDSKNHWIPMITLKGDRIYVCNLCGVVQLGTIQDLNIHIRGTKHKLNVTSLNKMHHPIHYASKETYSTTENKQITLQTSSSKSEILTVNKNKGSNKVSNGISDISENRLEQFKIDYVKLNAEALLEVEYMDSKNHWIPILTLKGDYIYICNLCEVVQLGTIQALYIHIIGRKHKLNVKSINKMHHPIHYASKEMYSKTENKQITLQTSSAKPEVLAVNKVSEISENRLEIFKLDYLKFNAKDLLEVKYMDSKNHWVAMITLKEDYIYVCNLCGTVQLGSIQNLKTHILGIKHKRNLKSINKMYHPIHSKSKETCSKSENKQKISQMPSAETETVAINKNTISNNLSNSIRGITGKRLEEFKENYVKMRTEELLKIRYRVGSKSWKDMFESNKSGYVCNLCGTNRIGRDMNFDLHIQGYEHTSRLQLIREIYYPSLCTSTSTAQSETMDVSSSSNSLQSVSWVPERKQMGNLSEFKLKYMDLSISNLLMVQYQTDEGKWAFLIAFDKSRYKCNLCEVYVGDDLKLEVHLRGLFHKNRIMNSKLFHPFFCPGTKDLPAPPSTQIIGAFKNATTLKSLDLPIDDSARHLAECLRKTVIRAESLCQDGFKWVYKWLDIDVIMNIEFQTDTKPWNYMFAMENDLAMYLCQLCEEQVVYLENDDEVKRHVRSNFHSEHVNRIKSIYHEKLCGLATDKKIVPTVMDRLQNIISCTEYLVEVWMRSEIPVEYKSVIFRFQNILFESFIQEYVNLDIKTLKCIQYKTCNNEWKNMIASNESGYVCNLCQGEYLGNVDFVTCHIRLDRHTRILNSVAAVRHPSHAPFIKKAVTHSAEIQAIVKNIEENRKVETDYTRFFKLTMEEFKKTYVELHVDDIFEIQYKPTSENFWDFMFVEKSGTLLCNICWQTIILRIDRIAKHVLSSVHMENIQSIHGLYHPVFQPMKNVEKENLQGDALAKNIQKQHALLQSILNKFSNPDPTHEKPNDNSESDTEQDLDVNSQNCEEIRVKSISLVEKISKCSQLTYNGRQLLDQHKINDAKISKKPCVFYNKLTEHELTKVQFFNLHTNDWQYVLTSTQETIYFCKICEKNVGVEENAVKHTRGSHHIKCIDRVAEELKYPKASKNMKIGEKDLGIDYFLKTKYREIQCNKFRPMLVSSVKPVYKCKLCQVESIGNKSNSNHCHSIRHIKKLRSIRIRHPKYYMIFDKLNSTSKGSDPQSSAKDSNITDLHSTASIVERTTQLTVDNDKSNESFINNWIEKCAAFTANDLLKIQYRASETGDWCNMVLKSGQEKIYVCKVCDDKELKLRNRMVAHFTTLKHINQLAVKSWTLRHPKYYIALDFRKFIKSAQNEGTKDTLLCNFSNLADRLSYSHFEGDESLHSDSAQSERDTSKRTVDYFDLSAEELLKVEYRQPDSQNWLSIFSVHDKESYVCQLCQTNCTNLTGIITHFSTQCHLDLMRSTVKEWRHSVLCNSNGNVLDDSNDKRTNSNGQDQREKAENEFINTSKQSIASENVQKENFNLSCDDQSTDTDNTKSIIDSVRNGDSSEIEKSSRTMKANEDRLEVLKIFAKEYSGLLPDEFFKVQYREYTSSQWKQLVTTSKQEKYICQLCNNKKMKCLSKAPVCHFKTNRHLKRLERIDYKVRHPQYSVYFDHPVENSNEPENQKTAMKYNQMNFNEFFKLQYWDPTLNQWLNMLKREYIETITCTLCQNDIKSLNLLPEHFRIKQHLSAVMRVAREFRLPKLDVPSGTSTISANNDERQSKEICTSISEDGRKVQDQIESMAMKCIKCDLELDTCILTHLGQSKECMKYMVDNFPSFAASMRQSDNYNDVSEAILKDIYLYVRKRVGAPTPKQTLSKSDSSSECDISEDVLSASNAKSDAALFVDSHDGGEILNPFSKNDNGNTSSDKDICVFHPNKNVNTPIPSANSELDRFYEEESENPSNMIIASSSYSITYDANSLTKNISKQVSSGSSVTRNFDKLLMILKQLTALESVLGVLGPKSTNLLTKALALQSLSSNSTECVLITSENVLFLETVREKLLGLIEIGVLDSKREIATKRVLYDIIEYLKTGEDNVILI